MTQVAGEFAGDRKEWETLEIAAKTSFDMFGDGFNFGAALYDVLAC